MRFFIVFLVFLFSFSTFAQQFGVVDSDYILNKMPKYKEALKQLEELASKSQKEIDDKYKEVDNLILKYKKDEILLSEEMKIKRQNEIEAKKIEAKNMENQFFGKDGILIKKRKELIRPLQNLIYDAIEVIARKKNYNMVFDVTENYGILYYNRKIDESDAILKELGIK